MKDAYGFYVLLVLGLYLLTAAARFAESEFRSRALQTLFRRYRSLPAAEMILVAAVFLSAVRAGGSKPSGGTNGTSSAASATNAVLPPSGAWSVAVSNRTTGALTLYSRIPTAESSPSEEFVTTQRLTAAQYAARFALVRVLTNAAPWFGVPSNAAVHAPWARYGVAEDTFWLPATDWTFLLGGGAVGGAHVSSSGTLSFGRPKGSPRAAEMPDGTGLNFLAPLQAPLGTVPPAGRFWSAPTPSNTLLLTWENVLAGRDTNSPVTFQTELFPNGDFAYRYDLYGRTRVSALSNFAIGAQSNGGGETYALNDPSKLVDGLELRWRAFGVLDPNAGDNDGDGLTDYDELTLYGTDPSMPDTDLDGLPDAAELAAGTNPLARDTDGDGIPDGGDPNPLAPDTADADANGLPDAWETYWFGTGAVTAAEDTNGDGFSNLANLLTGADPAGVPPPGFAVTNAALAAGLDAWEIAPAFALDLPAGMTNVLSRTVPAARTSPWQQFFVSSEPGAAGAWSLDGLTLSWSAGTNSGTASASPSGDSLRLPLSSNLFGSVSVRLDPSRASGLLRSPSPLYLIRWTPQPAFSGGTNTASATWTNGVRYVAALLGSSGDAALPFTLDGSARPQKAGPGAEETAERSLPPDPGSAVRAVFGPGLAAGYLTAPAPAEAALPASGTNPPARVLLYRPEIAASDGAGTPLGRFSEPYPLDTAALRRQWRNNAAATGARTAGGFTVSTGIAAGALRILINGGEAAAFQWPDGGEDPEPAALRPAAARMSASSASASSSSCGCGDGTLVQIFLCDADIWDHCEDREPWNCRTREGCGCPDGTCSSECGCAACDSEGGGLGSLKFRIPLGSAGRDRVSGFLWLALKTPRAVTRDLFGILGDATVSASTNAGAVTVTCPAGEGRTLTLADIGNGVGIRVGDGGDTPDHRWEITNPGGDPNSVRLVRFDSAGNRVTDETYAYAGGVWSRTGNPDGAVETLAISGDLETDALRCEDRSLTSGGVTLSRTVACSEAVGSGASAAARVTGEYVWDGFSGGYRHRRSVYWSDALNARRNGLLRLRAGDDGSWEYRAYDSRGRELLSAAPLDGSACPEPLASGDAVTAADGLAALQGLACSAKARAYEPDAAAGDTADAEDSRSPRAVTGYIVRDGTATPVSREWKVYVRGSAGGIGTVSVRTVRAASASAAFADAANASSLSVAYAGAGDATVPAALWDLPLREESEDGTVRTWAYEFGNYTAASGAFAPAGDGACLRVTERTGTAASPDGVPGLSACTVETRDAAYGLVLRRETRLYTGSGDGPLLAREQSGYDARNRLLGTAYSDGTGLSNVWSCCRLEASTGRDGTRTEYGAVPGDSHWSRTAETSLGSLPGADGRFPAAETLTDALDRETNSVRAVMSNGTRDPAYAPLATRTEYPYGTDGYGVSTDPLGVATVTRTEYEDSAKITETSSSGVTNRTTETFGGNTVTEKFWDGKWTRETRSTSYDASGCRVETVTKESSDYPAYAASVTTYDFLGRVVSVVTPIGTTSNVYDGATSRLVSTSKTGSPDTLYAYDELGNLTTTALDVDGDGAITYAGSDRINRTETSYEEDADGWWHVTSSAVWTESGSDACVTSSVTRTRLTGLGSTAPATLGLPSGAVLTAQTEFLDWRDNVTRMSTYTDAGAASVWTVVETPGSLQPPVRKTLAGYAVSAVSSTAVTNSYTYDGFARQVSETDGRGNTSVTHYNDLGQTKWTEDAATNRTVYAYDDLGHRIAVTDPLSNTVHTAYDSLGNVIRNWGAVYPVEYVYDSQGRKLSMRTFRDENAAGDETRWLYDGATGLLTNKVYADNSRAAYAYTPDGKLASRVWARGVATDYSYDALGQITNINYSGATPDVSFGYDRLGRRVSAVTAAATNLFEYSGLDPVAETQNGVTVTRNCDALGRSAGFGLADGFTAAYGYDDFGRMNLVVSGTPSGTNDFRYAYLAGTGLVGAMTNSAGFRWRRAYEPSRDLIASVENGFGENAVSSFAYGNDADGRRAVRVDSGSVTNLFGYNVRSEVVGAAMGTNAYAYGYDAIGNRVFSAVNALTNTYAANSLNQYTAITGGSAASPTYDADGNTAWDGRFVHTWDAENRLANSVPGGTVTNGCRMVENVYDYQSRRIGKVVRQLSGRGSGYPLDPSQPGTWDVVETRQYVYDGWNVIRETVSAAGDIATNHYVWGLDLSGSLQGAGGVGGLLAVVRRDGAFFPCCDAGGNVAEYADGNGDVMAHREYSPFGETTVGTGGLADGFTFWWSTKPRCPVTGLNEYEYRRQDPAAGRWISEDPAGESGGANVYGFVANDPLDSVDRLGYLAVDHRAPDPRHLTPILMPADYFTSPKFALPDGSMPAVGEVLGSTTYGSGVISCECACKKGDKKKNIPTAYTVSCKVSWSAEVRLNLLLGRKGLPGAFGHEQRHVLAVKSNIESSIITPLSGRTDTFGKQSECTSAARTYPVDYLDKLQKLLNYRTNRHGVDGHPAANTFYDPLEGTVWKVPDWVK